MKYTTTKYNIKEDSKDCGIPQKRSTNTESEFNS